MRYFIKPSIFALTTIGASLAFSGNVQANVEHLPCPAGSTGPTSSGICNLGVLPDNISAYYSSAAQAVSADGTTVVGSAMNADGVYRAFRWRGDGAGLLDLGTLRADNLGNSFANKVSEDGGTIVGSAETDDGSHRAFRWIENGTGMLDLGSLRTDNLGFSIANDVSADGNTIAGDAENDDGHTRAFRWVDDGNGMLDLGTFRTDSTGDSHARAISADGSTIIGVADGDSAARAFRWRDDGKGLLDLGTLRADGSGNSAAAGVSADGSVIVGTSHSDISFNRAFRWVDDGKGMIDLGSLKADGSGDTWATGVSANGSTIIGGADTSDGARRAFRWTDDGVGMIDLGSLRADNLGSSQAEAISADGSTIVGSAENDIGIDRAFRWIDDGNGMLDLGTLRADNAGRSVATGVSADGSIIIGNAVNDSGDYRAFIWRTKMQDLGNLLASFPALTNYSEIAVAQQQSVADQLMGSSCSAEEGQKCLSIDGVVTNAAATSEDIGSRDSSGGQVTLGYGVDGTTTIGGTLNISATNLSKSGFDMDANTAASVWVEYSETGLAGTGLQADAAVGKGRASGKITRGRDLENIMLAAGNASLETFFAQASLGYGVQIKDWLVTPIGTLAYYDTSRSAYTETGSDFNAEYDRLSMKRTTATLELIGERRVSERGTLSLGAGVEHDLKADRVDLRGTSDLPGVENFDIESALNRHQTRGFATIGYSHDLGDNQTLSGSLRTGQSTFGNSAQTSVNLSYGIRF